jgi:hypothetical protein
MTTTTTQTPTIPPCPQWCTNGAGHEYDSWNPASDAIERFHDWDGPVTGGTTAWASISARESSLNGVVTTDAPHIYVSADQDMTAEQVRHYAADLLVAADKLDEISRRSQ